LADKSLDLLYLDPPTRGLEEEAAAHGLVETDFGRFPALQIHTLAELFQGRLPKLPPLVRPNRKASWVETGISHQPGAQPACCRPSTSGSIGSPTPVSLYSLGSGTAARAPRFWRGAIWAGCAGERVFNKNRSGRGVGNGVTGRSTGKRVGGTALVQRALNL